MTSLEELVLWANNLSRDDRLSDTLSTLEELVLYDNDLSRDDRLSDTLSKLTSLKKLSMGKCELSRLPAG